MSNSFGNNKKKLLLYEQVMLKEPASSKIGEVELYATHVLLEHDRLFSIL